MHARTGLGLNPCTSLNVRAAAGPGGVGSTAAPKAFPPEVAAEAMAASALHLAAAVAASGQGLLCLLAHSKRWVYTYELGAAAVAARGASAARRVCEQVQQCTAHWPVWTVGAQDQCTCTDDDVTSDVQSNFRSHTHTRIHTQVPALLAPTFRAMVHFVAHPGLLAQNVNVKIVNVMEGFLEVRVCAMQLAVPHLFICPRTAVG
eukprot:1161275-Pelagomonas_calceolata.AAC.7